MGQLAFASFGADYATRSPANTTMYKVIACHVNSFFALAESEEKRLPKFVREEFDAFLKCGIHAYGFIRLKCTDCPHERLVAFSCKKRGFCTSYSRAADE